MKKEHAEQIQNAIKAIEERQIDNIFFVACGGSMASLWKCYGLIQMRFTQENS